MRGRKDYFKQRTDRPIAASKQMRSTCNMIAMLMLAYAVVVGDVPVGLIAGAVLTGLVPASGRVFQTTFGQKFQNMMHTFSLTLFVGAIVILIFY